MIDKIVVGGIYRFKDDPDSSIKPQLRGKWFKVISHTKIEVYESDGSLIPNLTGDYWFTYGANFLKHIDSTSIEPVKFLSKFKLV